MYLTKKEKLSTYINFRMHKRNQKGNVNLYINIYMLYPKGQRSHYKTFPLS